LNPPTFRGKVLESPSEGEKSLRTIIVAGGAGFVGSSLALALKRDTGVKVTALDNLKRRGSELALERLRAGGVDFVHGDIRSPEDLEAAGECDLLLDCSAEPSVHAGYGASPAYLINTNLMGTVNCLEHARRHGAAVAFISTSRVYPIAPLRALPLSPTGDRLALPPGAAGPGWSEAGITEDFPLAGARSLYGTTKLASEMLVEEYRAAYGLRTLTYRCGVLAGPWQMGKVDQGFMVLWAARHLYGGTLGYMGFGGQGHQVRDVLHVDDLYDLLARQLADLDRWSGSLFNVGGGTGNALSLRELTALCRTATGRTVAMGSDPDTRETDIPWYVTDNARVRAATGWTPKRDVPGLVEDICRWLADHRAKLEPILG
jgi:CDP-paratose 2-epimerase